MNIFEMVGIHMYALGSGEHSLGRNSLYQAHSSRQSIVATATHSPIWNHAADKTFCEDVSGEVPDVLRVRLRGGRWLWSGVPRCWQWTCADLCEVEKMIPNWRAVDCFGHEIGYLLLCVAVAKHDLR